MASVRRPLRLFLLILIAGAAHAAPIEITGAKQLFLDDYLIAS